MIECYYGKVQLGGTLLEYFHFLLPLTCTPLHYIISLVSSLFCIFSLFNLNWQLHVMCNHVGSADSRTLSKTTEMSKTEKEYCNKVLHF